MATIREKRPGVWEVRQYVGRDARGRPRQISQIVRGSRRDAERAASELAVRPRTYEGATTTLGELLHLWVEASLPTWAPSSAENQRSRARLVQADPIASIAVARLTPVDVDRWHARMAMQGLGASAARNRHSVVRAALSLALRWGWVPSNPAAAAPLRRRRPSSRDALQTAEVRAVLDSAELLVAGGALEPHASLGLRLAAVTGARRSELAALRWDELAGSRLTIDSSIATLRDRRGRPTLRDDPTKTGNRRTVTLDEGTLSGLSALRASVPIEGPWILSVGSRPLSPERLSA